MESKKLALLCRELADNKKAEDIAVLDVRKLSSVTDYFVIATGTSNPHLRAIVEEISSKLREDHDLRPSRSEGLSSGTWVVLDYFDVIVHVMHTETRKLYDLEGLWGDARPVTPAKPRKKAAAEVEEIIKRGGFACHFADFCKLTIGLSIVRLSVRLRRVLCDIPFLFWLRTSSACSREWPDCLADAAITLTR